MMKRLKFLIKVTFVLSLLFAGWMYHYATTPLNISAQDAAITIKPSASFRGVTKQLIAQNIIQDDVSFILLAKLLKLESMIQAGDYTLNGNITPYQLLHALNNGKTSQARITFIEGKTFKDMRAILAKHEGITHTIDGLTNETILQKIGAKQQHPEGLFFPDTYYFDRGTEDIKVLKNAYITMQNKLEQAWSARDQSLSYKNSYEALIMASIIEKETGKGSERPTISGVFNNRLRIGMRLQTDPTVIYGMGARYKGNIRKKDLRRDTVYNTYTRYGLPPTPIAMPGLAAIDAALHPEKTKALYFVGKGDGSHQFSESLSAHNRAVRKYQLKR